MTKAEIIAKAAQESGLSAKDTAAAFQAIFGAIEEALVNGEKVSFVGFGNFEVRTRGARIGCNPRTKEKIEIPAVKVPVFKPGKQLKENVNA